MRRLVGGSEGWASEEAGGRADERAIDMAVRLTGERVGERVGERASDPCLLIGPLTYLPSCQPS